jgi:hypothetical protein
VRGHRSFFGSAASQFFKCPRLCYHKGFSLLPAIFHAVPKGAANFCQATIGPRCVTLLQGFPPRFEFLVVAGGAFGERGKTRVLLIEGALCAVGIAATAQHRFASRCSGHYLGELCLVLVMAARLALGLSYPVVLDSRAVRSLYFLGKAGHDSLEQVYSSRNRTKPKWE